jgi:phytoene synthase
LYRHGEDGIARLPQNCRAGIGAAALLYREIGQEVARRGHDCVAQRAVVSLPRKLFLLARSLAGVGISPQNGRLTPPPSARFLVEAVADCAHFGPASIDQSRQWWDFKSRAIWVIGLFDKLARREWPMDAEAP